MIHKSFSQVYCGLNYLQTISANLYVILNSYQLAVKKTLVN